MASKGDASVRIGADFGRRRAERALLNCVESFVVDRYFDDWFADERAFSVKG